MLTSDTGLLAQSAADVDQGASRGRRIGAEMGVAPLPFPIGVRLAFGERDTQRVADPRGVTAVDAAVGLCAQCRQDRFVRCRALVGDGADERGGGRHSNASRSVFDEVTQIAVTDDRAVFFSSFQQHRARVANPRRGVRMTGDRHSVSMRPKTQSNPGDVGLFSGMSSDVRR